VKNLVLITEDVVVYVVFLGRLRCQNKCLHESTHRLTSVGQLSSHLHTNGLTKQHSVPNLYHNADVKKKTQIDGHGTVSENFY